MCIEIWYKIIADSLSILGSLLVDANIKKTDFIPPVKLEDGLKETIEYEFGLSPKNYTTWKESFSTVKIKEGIKMKKIITEE